MNIEDFEIMRISMMLKLRNREIIYLKKPKQTNKQTNLSKGEK